MGKRRRSDRIKGPRKNCSVCKGRGQLWYADGFDRDNGEDCWKCKKRAKASGCIFEYWYKPWARHRQIV